jgi:hypothetical protein
MKCFSHFLILFILAASTSTGQVAPQVGRPETISGLKFLGEHVIPNDFTFAGTVVGGLSGIDYDSSADLFYLISDDRGAYGGVRIYEMKVTLIESGFKDVNFIAAHYVTDENGARYPTGNAKENPDPESIRFHPQQHQLYWASEGERSVSSKEKVLLNPFIHVMDTFGIYKSRIDIPENLHMSDRDNGPRQNSALEGLAFGPKFEYLYASLEEPLHEDGPKADVMENGAITRIYKFDISSGKNVAQFAYSLEPVAFPPNPTEGFKINGISEILGTGDEDKLITVERSFSAGRAPCTIRVFLTDLSGAEDVKAIRSLKKKPDATRSMKRLLLNMDSLGIYIDNVEGVTFGPILSNGHVTLLFVTDNNFHSFQKTQLLLFEVIP